MMRLRSFVAVAMVTATLTAGCGGSSSTAQKVNVDATPVGLRHAAETTLAKGSSKVEFTVGMTIQGREVTMAGTGAMDPANKRFMMSFDARQMFEQLGASSSVPDSVKAAFDKPIEVLVDGTVMYMHFAAFGAMTGSSKEWIKLDLAAANEDASALLGGGGGAFGSDPTSFLQFLEGAGKVTKVGEEDVRGVHTTHFSGSYTLEDALAALPADQRDKARRAFDGFGVSDEAKTQPIPFEAWVDDEGLVRRIETSFDPSTLGSSATRSPVGKTTMRIEFFDFGAPVDLELPSDDEVQDLSQLLAGASSQFSTVGSSIDASS
jgi:hypothetical protein